MKNLFIITILTIVITTFYSCDETNETVPSKSNNQTVYANYGECLEFDLMKIEQSKTETVVKYSFENNVFKIDHLNAGFNCCIDDVRIDFDLADNQIIITETDINPACDCLCLYNIDYEIKNITAGTYTIRINESVKPEKDDPIIFIAEFMEGTQGEEIFLRTGYPWGI